jgi:hypothetical protein
MLSCLGKSDDDEGTHMFATMAVIKRIIKIKKIKKITKITKITKIKKEIKFDLALFGVYWVQTINIREYF